MGDDVKQTRDSRGAIEASCREIIERYTGYVKAVVVNKLGKTASREDIEDCISDVFAELYRTPDKIPDAPDEIKYLLGTIAKRRAVDYFRRLTSMDRNSSDINDEQLSRIVSGDNTEDEIERRGLQKALWKAVEQLGEPDSSILVFQYFYRMKVRDIAGRLSLSTAAVNKRSLRARQRVREMLLQQGYKEV